MELNEANVEVVGYAVVENVNAQLHDLDDLQLALVGGGVGEITPY